MRMVVAEVALTGTGPDPAAASPANIPTQPARTRRPAAPRITSDPSPRRRPDRSGWPGGLQHGVHRRREAKRQKGLDRGVDQTLLELVHGSILEAGRPLRLSRRSGPRWSSR